MDMNCKVIEDILKFFEKNDISPESEELINEHIAQCSECAEKYNTARKKKEAQEAAYIGIAKKIQRKKKRTALKIILSTAVVCVLILNFLVALRTKKPLITLYTKTESDFSSTFTRSYSLGFVIDNYDTEHGKYYTRIKPWFSAYDLSIRLPYKLYASLMDQLSKSEANDTDISDYFDVHWFSSAKIFEITQVDDEVTIYMSLLTKGFITYQKLAYSVNENDSSNFIKVTGTITEDTITVKDVWHPVDIFTDPYGYFPSIKESFPSYVYSEILNPLVRNQNGSSGLTSEIENNVLVELGTPVSSNRLSLNTNTGYLYITAYNENRGSYQSKGVVVLEEYVTKKAAK